MRNVRSQTMFVACISVAGILLVQMALYTFQMLFRWSMPPNLFDVCGNWLRSLGLRMIPILLDVLVVSTFAGVLWLIGIQAAACFRVSAGLVPIRNESRTRELDRKYTGGSSKLIVVEHKQPAALTLGFVRPVIVLSTGLLELLDEEELEAVIRHEQFHLRSRDPMRTFLTYMASKVMWYIPVLKWCHHYYKITREVLADRYAMERTGSSAGLAGAILKLLKHKPVSVSFAHSSFTDTSMNIRIKQLLDPRSDISVRLPFKAMLVSISVAIGLTVLLIPGHP